MNKIGEYIDPTFGMNVSSIEIKLNRHHGYLLKSSKGCLIRDTVIFKLNNSYWKVRETLKRGHEKIRTI